MGLLLPTPSSPTSPPPSPHNMIAKYELSPVPPRASLADRLQPAPELEARHARAQAEEPSRAGQQDGEPTDRQPASPSPSTSLPLVARAARLRACAAENIGQLLSIKQHRGRRTSEVRPELALATFCEGLQQRRARRRGRPFSRTEPSSPESLPARTAWPGVLDIRAEHFVDWQGEHPGEQREIPTGGMPRTMDIILRGEIVDRAKAGEKCIFTGSADRRCRMSASWACPASRNVSIRDDRGADAGGRPNRSRLQACWVCAISPTLAFRSARRARRVVHRRLGRSPPTSTVRRRP